MNQTRVKEEAERLRNIARNLSYSEVESESIIKFVLNEVAMRLETGWYERDSGFEPIEINRICTDREHDGPNMLYVPPGQIYKHVCRSCGNVVRIAGSSVSW